MVWRDDENLSRWSPECVGEGLQFTSLHAGNVLQSTGPENRKSTVLGIERR